MKRMKELTSLKDDALEASLLESKKELMKFSSQVASGTIPKNPGRMKAIRKSIARILTIQTERRNKPKA
jgi:large subunit ribosomal protein L29